MAGGGEGVAPTPPKPGAGLTLGAPVRGSLAYVPVGELIFAVPIDGEYAPAGGGVL